jgi:two-component system LytT family sensor kinase
MSEFSTRRLYWTLQVGGWTVFGIGMALTRIGRFPIDYMIATKAALAASGLLLSLPLRAMYQRTLRDDTSLARTLTVTVVASFVVAQVWTAIYNLADAPIASAFLDRTIRVDTFTELLAGSYYHTFMMLAWSLLYVGIKRQQSLMSERERSLRAEALASRAQLQALRFQLQPHFLFNSLNALSTLIVEGKQSDASEMLSRLSDYLRHTLAGSDEQEVRLDDELTFARRYLDIEQVRFGPRLVVEIDAPADAREALVPNLILQPLLENAVRYGVAPQLSSGKISIHARRQAATLTLLVIDEGGDEVPPAPNGANAPALSEANVTTGTGNGTGVGLANTRARLEQLYGSRHTLRTGPRGNGYSVEIVLPYSTRHS